jgi:hypothetical protein
VRREAAERDLGAAGHDLALLAALARGRVLTAEQDRRASELASRLRDLSAHLVDLLDNTAVVRSAPVATAPVVKQAGDGPHRKKGRH